MTAARNSASSKDLRELKELLELGELHRGAVRPAAALSVHVCRFDYDCGNVYSSLIIIRFVMPSFAGDVMQLPRS